jgi:hypothetical protein
MRVAYWVVAACGLSALVAGNTAAEPHDFKACLSGDARLGDDISLWGGVRTDACRRLGRFCVGGSLRLSADTRAKGGGSDFGTSRTVIEAVLTADVPFELGRLQLVPGLGVGPTLLYARRRGFWGNESDVSLRPLLWAHTALELAVAAGTAVRFDIGYSHTAFAESELGSPSEDRAEMAGMPAHVLVVGVGLQWGWR